MRGIILITITGPFGMFNSCWGYGAQHESARNHRSHVLCIVSIHICMSVHMYTCSYTLHYLMKLYTHIHAYMHTCTHVTYITTCIQGTVKTQVDDLSGECSFVSGKCTKHRGAIGPPKRNIYSCAKCPHLKLFYTKLFKSATGATRYRSDTVAISICSKCSPRPHIDPFHPFPPFLFPSYSGMRYSASFFLPFSFLFLFSFPFSFLFLASSFPFPVLFLPSSFDYTDLFLYLHKYNIMCSDGPPPKAIHFFEFLQWIIHWYKDIHVYTRIGGIWWYIRICMHTYMHA